MFTTVVTINVVCRGALRAPALPSPSGWHWQVVEAGWGISTDTMGASLEVFYYSPAYCTSALASTVKPELGGQFVWKMLFKGGPFVWCLKGSRGGTGRSDSWLWLGQIWKKGRSVILSTLWEGYNKLMSLWGTMVCPWLKESIFSGGGYVLDLCLSCSWILCSKNFALPTFVK